MKFLIRKKCRKSAPDELQRSRETVGAPSRGVFFHARPDPGPAHGSVCTVPCTRYRWRKKEGGILPAPPRDIDFQWVGGCVERFCCITTNFQWCLNVVFCSRRLAIAINKKMMFFMKRYQKYTHKWLKWRSCQHFSVPVGTKHI